MIKKQKIYILEQLSKWLGILLMIAIPLEILMFPSLPNLFGCLMTLLSYLIFRYFLKQKYILRSPFAFFMYLSMFMYRYLPLLATLTEGNPISVGFERPYETFIYESLVFILSSLAYYLVCNPKQRVKNSTLQKLLFKFDFFKIKVQTIWFLGFIGFAVRLYTFSTGGAEYGDVGGKFLDGVKYLLYAPMVLLFLDLTGLPKYRKTNKVWIYLTIVFLINIASNSRAAMITPIAIFGLLFFLHAVKNNIQIKEIISPRKFFILMLFLVFGLNMLSDLSYAMLYTRGGRSSVSKVELFQQTIATYQNKSLMQKIKTDRSKKTRSVENYTQGWTEAYIDNFMLNRYANLRITDETIYHADRRGYGDPVMQEHFWIQLILILPNPVLKFLNINYNKNDYRFSRGDLLSGGSLGSLVVTSHVGDGLATFGYWYFPFQFILNICVFFLLNTFLYFKGKKVIYSAFGLMNVFVFLGMFRNANGMIVDLGYCIRRYWQGIITYLIVLTIVGLIQKVLFKK
ncbi:hypothetical protein [Polaribacter sp. Asnod1-A03]|uniref:hypothetical protein n=1 Tax=Polaribacter sp. Asnod1-A03 TaxID=3160581 RepID=UPI0038660EE1